MVKGKTINLKFFLMTMMPLILFFGLMELSLRAVGYRYEPWGLLEGDPYLFWRLRPDHDGRHQIFSWQKYSPIPGPKGDNRDIHINSQGFRGKELRDKKDSLFRIVAMGDSCTFGLGVSDDENTYPAQLEVLLNSHPSSFTYEVVNAGVNGYSTFQGLRFMKKNILPLEPDVIIIQYVWNDHWSDTQSDKDRKEANHVVLRVKNFLSRHMRTYQLLLSGSHLLMDTFLKDEEPLRKTFRVTLEDFRKNFEDMVRCAKERGIKVLVLTTPCGMDAFKGPTATYVSSVHAAYNEVVKKVAQEEQVPLVNCVRAFKERDMDGLFFPDLIHPSEMGHKLMADEVYNALRSQGLAS